ncbi:MAG: glycoside hydrolase family 99-like domain-containing protein [Oscillospiraceae bacterium]|nr:glycoside hydrolase family 99-like domain-containing protein [Oscillospiraceae bacterium]
MAEINSTDKIKTIAFYLPQFHCIPENDAAWGKGFTEWTNVKKARPQFHDHYQPKVPLNKNYYNLLDKETQEWQSELAQRNGVYGFCYYHYWFKDGKKLLEKPAENMLKNKDITIPFCFCWANENWTRNWDGGNREIIVEQDYGDINDWEKHFLYLLPFFQDERYITYNGSPILIVYKPELINDFKEMADYLKKRCRDYGFNGCEIMVQFPQYRFSPSFDDDTFDHYICFEPLFTSYELQLLRERTSSMVSLRRKLRRLLGDKLSDTLVKLLPENRKFRKYSYDEYWNCILSRSYDSEKYIAGAFVDWDNTARNKKGILFTGASPEKFENYYRQLTEKIKAGRQPQLIFINAWNEWGEGAYLEPDEKNGYGYLEAVKRCMNDE